MLRKFPTCRIRQLPLQDFPPVWVNQYLTLKKTAGFLPFYLRRGNKSVLQLNQTLAELRLERARIDAAIASLEKLARSVDPSLLSPSNTSKTSTDPSKKRGRPSGSKNKA